MIIRHIECCRSRSRGILFQVISNLLRIWFENDKALPSPMDMLLVGKKNYNTNVRHADAVWVYGVNIKS